MPDRHGSGQALHFFMDMGFFMDVEIPEVHSASSKRCCGKPHSDRSDMSADKASDRMQNNRDFPLSRKGPW